MAANCTCVHDLHYNIDPLSEKNYNVAIYMSYGETTEEALSNKEGTARGTFTISPSSKKSGTYQMKE